MEAQKFVNLLNGSENEYAKFASKKLYVIDSESKDKYSLNDLIKFLTKSIESSLCDYSDAYILVTGNIAVKRRNAADTADIALGAITQVAFKNRASFEKCSTVDLMVLLMVLLLMEHILSILQFLYTI